MNTTGPKESDMPSAAKIEQLLYDYVRAKDGNRPVCMARVFEPNAKVGFKINTGAIHFPAELAGLESINKALVKEFNRKYENILTFYLRRPKEFQEAFSCGWLVAMTEIDTQQVRIGCGKFDWQFRRNTGRAAGLTITIDLMLALDEKQRDPIFAWLLDQAYPWIDVNRMLSMWPELSGLSALKGSILDEIGYQDSLHTPGFQ